MELRELTNEEFKNFTNNFYLKSLYQTTEYGLTMNTQEQEPIFLGLINESNEIVAASLILIEKLGQFKYAYAPRGFLIDYTNKELLTEFTNRIKEFLKKKSVMAIKISPLIIKEKNTPYKNEEMVNPDYDNIFNILKELKYYHLGYNNLFESYKPRFEAIANLNKDTQEMFNTLDNDTKNNIANCDLAGLRVYKGIEKNLDIIFDELREKRKFSKEFVEAIYKYYNDSKSVDVFYVQLEPKIFLVNTQKEYQKQMDICNKANDEVFKVQGKANNDVISKKIIEDNKLSAIKNQLVYATNLLRDYPNGIVIASAMVIKCNNQAYVLLDGYNKEFKNLCPKYILIWKLMEKYATDGYTELNLGGMTNPSIESEFSDLNKFKMQFNSSCIEYAGDFELVTNYPLYTIYRNAAPIRKLVKKDEK